MPIREKKPHIRISNQTKADIIVDLADTDKSKRQIARDHGVSMGTVERINQQYEHPDKKDIVLED